MQRLVAFGCSLTYGEGLSDCWDTQGSTFPRVGKSPSQYSWPKLLADQLNFDIVNEGIPGTSNKFIAHNILNYNFEAEDTVIVLWTFFIRSCIFHKDYKITRLMPNDTDKKGIPIENRKINKNYYKWIYTYHNSIFENFMQINLVKNRLDQNNIKNHHFTIDDFLLQNIPQWNNVDLKKISFDKSLPLGADNMHPGEQAHKNFAEQIYELII